MAYLNPSVTDYAIRSASSRRTQERLWQTIDAGDPEAFSKIARLIALRNQENFREGGPEADNQPASDLKAPSSAPILDVLSAVNDGDSLLRQ